MAQPQADSQAARNAGIVALAAAQLAGLWPRVDWASPDAVNAVRTVYGAIVQQFGRSAAAVAATTYDQLRATKGLTSEYRAVPADPFPQAAIDKAVSSAFLGVPQPAEHVHNANAGTASTQNVGQGPTQHVVTSDLPVEQRVPARLEDGLQRHVLQPARDTIAANASADPAKPRYIRVPSGPTTCAFCVLLASREINDKFGGYHSAQSAKFVVGRGKVAAPRGNQPIGEKYHNHCDCEPVAIFPGQTAGDVSPNFHDFQDMYYKAAADAGTHRDTKKILASMRQLHGLK